MAAAIYGFLMQAPAVMAALGLKGGIEGDILTSQALFGAAHGVAIKVGDAVLLAFR